MDDITLIASWFIRLSSTMEYLQLKITANRIPGDVTQGNVQ